MLILTSILLLSSTISAIPANMALVWQESIENGQTQPILFTGENPDGVFISYPAPELAAYLEEHGHACEAQKDFYKVATVAAVAVLTVAAWRIGERMAELIITIKRAHQKQKKNPEKA